MLLIALLAASGRCLSAEACPTDAEIAGAVDAYNRMMTSAVGMALGPDVHMYAPSRATRIDNVQCGEARAYEPDATVNCSFTYRTGRLRQRQISTFVKRDGSWTITEALMVTLTRE